MKIISDSESRQILKNELLRQAREQYAAQLKSADTEERQNIMEQLERDVEKELRRRGSGPKRNFFSKVLSGQDNLLH